ncbi:MAG: UDP-N-acetylmuramoyl-tripeptide--D-alanyl-D-alanine ligase, partial [Methylophagaceae bacterium]
MTTMLTLAIVAKLLNCPKPVKEGSITGAAIDSRQVKPGDLFIAIEGAKADGHDFIAAARQAGASAALVS